jgi:hypothetical protein
MTQNFSKNEKQEQQSCCPVCNSKAITSFLIRENCHINDNVVFDDKEAAVAINRATLNLAFCEECGFIFNKDFDLDKVDYGTLYDIEGTTFANLIDPESQWISCAVDLNPKKQGKYMVGTGLPIIGYEKLKDFGITYAIVSNPYYIEENANLLKKANLDVQLLTVDSL